MSRAFNGTSHYIEVDSAPLTTYPFTMAAWAYMAADTNDNSILWLGDKDASNAYATLAATTISGGSNGVYAAVRTAAGQESAFSSAVPSLNTWFHALGTYSSATLREAYINGGNGGSNTVSRAMPTCDRFSIGRRADSSPGPYFNGNIAHCAVWNVVLTADEIAMLGAGRVSPLMIRPHALVLYVPYLGRDSSEIDIIGGRTLAVTGATSSSNEPPVLWLPGRRKIFILSSSGQSISAGLNSETDSAFALSRLKQKAVGLTSTADSVLVLTKLKSLAVGLNSEADSTQTVVHTKQRSPGLNTEADSVLALTKLKSKAVGLNTEDDSVLVLTKSKARTLALQTEANSAFTATHIKQKAVGINSETASVFTVGRLKSRTLALLEETDTAFSVEIPGTIQVQVELNVETDTAFALGKVKVKAISLISETDSALVVRPARQVPVALNTETDSVFALTGVKQMPVQLTQETDDAHVVTRMRSYVLAQAEDTSSAFSMTFYKVKDVSLCIETDTAFIVTTSTAFTSEGYLPIQLQGSRLSRILANAENHRVMVLSASRGN